MDPYQDLQIEANTKRVDDVSAKSDNNKESSVSLCKPEVGHVEASLELGGGLTVQTKKEVNMKLLILQELKSFEGQHEKYIDLCHEFLNFPCSPSEKKLQMQFLKTRTSEAKVYVRKVVSELSNEERLVRLLEDVKNEKSRVQQDIFNAKKDLKDEEKKQKQDKSKKKKK